MLSGRIGRWNVNNTEEFLLLILIGLFANANDINIANNTSILLLFALLLFNGGNFIGNGNSGCCSRYV